MTPSGSPPGRGGRGPPPLLRAVRLSLEGLPASSNCLRGDRDVGRRLDRMCPPWNYSLTPSAAGAELVDPTIEEQVGQSINAVFLHLEEWSYEQLVEGFRAIEERFARLGNSEPEAFREVMRRVAEDFLLVAQEKEQPIDECERCLQHVLMLGWSDLYRAAEVLLAFGRYCIERGRSELARKYLEPVVKELELLSPLPAQEELHANLLASTRKSIRATVAAGGSGGSVVTRSFTERSNQSSSSLLSSSLSMRNICAYRSASNCFSSHPALRGASIVTTSALIATSRGRSRAAWNKRMSGWMTAPRTRICCRAVSNNFRVNSLFIPAETGIPTPGTMTRSRAFSVSFRAI